jgi:hypothetical protein
MGKGGARPGAGRKPGSTGKAVAKVRATAPTPKTAKLDILPANVMLNNMRRVYLRALNEEARQLRLPKDQRDISEADKLFNVAQVYAVDCAPYYHPKLAALAAMKPPDPTAIGLEQMILASLTLPANQNAGELPAPASDDDLEAAVLAAE